MHRVGGGYVDADFPQLYYVNNIVTIARCDLGLLSGIVLLVIAYGLRWPALLSRWLGCFTYLIAMGYFFWRTVIILELSPLKKITDSEPVNGPPTGCTAQMVRPSITRFG